MTQQVNSGNHRNMHVLDDVLDDDLRKSFLDHDYNGAKSNGLGDFWYGQKYDDIEFPYAQKILRICSSYADISKMVGYEMHHNYFNGGTYHLDKDEILYKKTDEVKCPIVSVVYYLSIEEMVGGTFYTSDITIIPKTNRLIIFSSDLHHGYAPVTGGTRISVGINPWGEAPMYPDEN